MQPILLPFWPTEMQCIVLNILLPTPPTFSSHSASEVFFGTDGGRIGGEYLKVIYEEYTDDTFTTLKPTPESLHLGVLGKVSSF